MRGSIEGECVRVGKAKDYTVRLIKSYGNCTLLDIVIIRIGGGEDYVVTSLSCSADHCHRLLPLIADGKSDLGKRYAGLPYALCYEIKADIGISLNYLEIYRYISPITVIDNRERYGITSYIRRIKASCYVKVGVDKVCMYAVANYVLKGV